MKFWIICGWDQYYPCSGIGNIVSVTSESYERAVEILKQYETSGYGRDYYEVFSSDELPWEKLNGN